MESHHDSELLHSLAVEADHEQHQESALVPTNEKLADSSVKDDDEMKNENSSLVIITNVPKKSRTPKKRKSPEVVKIIDDSEQNVWGSRLRRRPMPDFNKGQSGSASGSKSGPNVAADPKKLSVSLRLTLTKKEITEDFILMTGKKPPQKPKKRTKAEKDRIPAFEMGSTLTEVTVDTYNKKIKEADR